MPSSTQTPLSTQAIVDRLWRLDGEIHDLIREMEGRTFCTDLQDPPPPMDTLRSLAADADVGLRWQDGCPLCPTCQSRMIDTPATFDCVRAYVCLAAGCRTTIRYGAMKPKIGRVTLPEVEALRRLWQQPYAPLGQPMALSEMCAHLGGYLGWLAARPEKSELYRVADVYAGWKLLWEALDPLLADPPPTFVSGRLGHWQCLCCPFTAPTLEEMAVHKRTCAASMEALVEGWDRLYVWQTGGLHGDGG